MDRNHDVIIFTSKYFILRRRRVANFPGIVKILTIFIKATVKDSKKVIRIKLKTLKVCPKMQSISVFLDIAKCADFW